MNLFFVIDELSDVGDEKQVWVLADTIMDAIRDPHNTRPTDEPIVGLIAKQYVFTISTDLMSQMLIIDTTFNRYIRFWERATKWTSPTSQRHFVATFNDYCESVVTQARDRVSLRVHTVDTYFAVRRENVGAKPSFALLEMDMNLPDEALEHPVMVDLTTWAIDMLIIGNVSAVTTRSLSPSRR